MLHWLYWLYWLFFGVTASFGHSVGGEGKARERLE
jgi:hypothetical protein